MTKRELARLTWAVDVDGYELLQNPSGELVICRKGGAMREYQPLQETPALHRAFADIPSTPDGLLAFVEEFGFLGIDDMGFPPDKQRLEGIASCLGFHLQVREVIRAIDKKSGKSRSKAVETLTNSIVAPHFRLDFSWEVNGPEYHFNPLSLGGVIGLMIADELAQGRKYNQCRACKKWFQVGPSRQGAGASRLPRSDSETCSDACRSKLWRLRQKGEKL